MIGGGAFLRLKTGSNGRESSKQPEIPLAGFATILLFGRRGALSKGMLWRDGRKAGKTHPMVKTMQGSGDMANVPSRVVLFFKSQY